MSKFAILSRHECLARERRFLRTIGRGAGVRSRPPKVPLENQPGDEAVPAAPPAPADQRPVLPPSA